MSSWKDHHPGLSFRTLVCMYINDCRQYLRAAQEGREPDLASTEFEPTENETSIYYGLRELKDLCIRVAGGDPLPWKDWPAEKGG